MFGNLAQEPTKADMSIWKALCTHGSAETGVQEKMKVLQTENDQHQATIRRVFSVVEP